MKFDSDDFELFGVPPQFDQDPAALDARWRALLTEVHPDRFASEGPAAQRLAMQWSVRINEAHRRLKDPVRRAAYLCELKGWPIRAEENTVMPRDFLMQQMEWRESLEDASGASQVEALSDAVAAYRKRALAELGDLIDEAGDLEAAVERIRALMFVDRFAEDVDARLEALES